VADSLYKIARVSDQIKDLFRTPCRISTCSLSLSCQQITFHPCREFCASGEVVDFLQSEDSLSALLSVIEERLTEAVGWGKAA
jgi:hypothetical protein